MPSGDGMHFDPLPVTHWHPVLEERAWDGKPRRVDLLGNPIVLFRTSTGGIAALHDACRHRRFPLSEGRLRGDCLVCPYHGWEYAADGSIRCPSFPAAALRARRFEAAQRKGLIWLKEPGFPDTLPVLDFPGYFAVAPMGLRCDAPVEILLDNMSELEHTAAVHGIFGFETEELSDIRFEYQARPDSLYIYYEGRQRPLGAILRASTGLRNGDTFKQDAHVRFAPLRNEYELRWESPAGEARALRLKFVIYYVAETPRASRMFVFLYTNQDPAGRFGFNRLVAAVLRKLVMRELRLDVAIIEKAKRHGGGPDDWLATRLDRPLLEIRKRLAQMFRSEAPADHAAGPALGKEAVLPGEG